MIATADLHWLAGLLEGEGCFLVRRHNKVGRSYGYPGIQLKMTDADVVERAHLLMRCNMRVRASSRRDWKDVYEFAVIGSPAAGWMMTLYPLMGLRRQAKIREVLLTCGYARKRDVDQLQAA